MQEPTFASLEFEQKKRQTRRERFLERIETLVPWSALEARVEPVSPKPGRGRQPYPLAVMLRIHVVQLCYNPRLRGGRLSATRRWRTCSTRPSRCAASAD